MSTSMLDVLSNNEIQKIHNASLNLLDQVGMKVGSEKLRSKLKEAGARVDGKIVKLSPNQVEKALEVAPKDFSLYDRRGDQLPIPAPESYITSRVTLPQILENENKETKKPRLHDVKNFCKLANHFEEIDMILMNDTPSADVEEPDQINHLITTKTVFQNTWKHILCAPINYKAAKTWLTLAGESSSKSSISKKPVISGLVSPTSPLKLDEDTGDVLYLLAERGIPVIVLPMASAGATSPMTIAGTLVTTNAENLFPITVAQIIQPEVPCFYGIASGVFEVREGGLSLGSPSFPLLMSGALELASYYKLPTKCGSNYTDSFEQDVQCGVEKGLSNFASLVGDADIIDSCGSLGAASTLNLEQVVIDLDIFLATRHFSKGITVDKDHLAVEVAKRVGHGGHYLTDEHTIKWSRSDEHCYTKSCNRIGNKENAKSQLNRAHEIVESILQKPSENVISEEQRRRVEEKASERKLEINATT